MLCSLWSLNVSAQGDDSLFVDSSDFATYEYEETADTTEYLTVPAPDQDAPADNAQIKSRSFSKKQIEQLKDDADLNYKEPPSVGASLWDRFLAWLIDFLSSVFDKAYNTSWGNAIVYLIGIALVIVVVMMLLKVDAFKMLYGGGNSKINAQILDENIHEMDFDQLIQEAVRNQDYRRGIRLLFLYSLKLLSDKHLIHWENGKTNREYVAELQQPDLKPGLNELSFYFDYAWYGNFSITADTFGKAESIFKNWKQKVNT